MIRSCSCFVNRDSCVFAVPFFLLPFPSPFRLIVFQVLPATPGGAPTTTASTTASSTTRANATADELEGFELEVGVDGKTIQCIVGDACLSRLPRALWDNESESGVARGGGEGGGGGGGGVGGVFGEGAVVRIVPVLFTQGIDIQQSMSHASSSAREKATFQASSWGTFCCLEGERLCFWPDLRPPPPPGLVSSELTFPVVFFCFV